MLQIELKLFRCNRSSLFVALIYTFDWTQYIDSYHVSHSFPIRNWKTFESRSETLSRRLLSLLFVDMVMCKLLQCPRPLTTIVVFIITHNTIGLYKRQTHSDDNKWEIIIIYLFKCILIKKPLKRVLITLFSPSRNNYCYYFWVRVISCLQGFLHVLCCCVLSMGS